MHHPRLHLFLACALIALAACHARADGHAPKPLVETTPAAIAAPVDAAIRHARSTVAEAVMPAATGMRDIVQSVVSPPAQMHTPGISPAAVALIVRYEITDARHYAARLQYPVWPGGASGITLGIGYDLGQQSRRAILADWRAHPQAPRLANASGVAGLAAQSALPAYRDIATPYPLAYDVFASASLPVYRAAARAAFLPGFDALPADAQGALVSLVYNRGTSMLGDRNAEKRAIRDVCIPARDTGCIGRELRAMCRLWQGDALSVGLCARRQAEAQLAEGRA